MTPTECPKSRQTLHRGIAGDTTAGESRSPRWVEALNIDQKLVVWN